MNAVIEVWSNIMEDDVDPDIILEFLDFIDLLWGKEAGDKIEYWMMDSQD